MCSLLAIHRLCGGREGMAAVVIDGAHALNFTDPHTAAALIAAQLDGTALTESRIAGELDRDSLR